MTLTGERQLIGQLGDLVLSEWIRSQDDIVFLTGSRAEGFGNSGSDGDIHIVYSDNSPVFSGPKIVLRNGFQLQFKSASIESLKQLAHEMDNFASQLSSTTSFRDFNFRDLDSYYRTAIGVPIYNEAGFKMLAAEFNKQVAAQVLRYYAHWKSRFELTRAGYLASRGRDIPAKQFARQAGEHAIDVYLAERGEAFTSLKWRLQKLRRLEGESEFYKKAWILESMSTATAEDYIKFVTRLCDSVGITPLPASGAQVMSPRRASHVELFQLSGSNYLISNRTDIFEIDPLTAAFWRACDGSRTLSQLAEEIRKDRGLMDDAHDLAYQTCEALERRALLVAF